MRSEDLTGLDAEFPIIDDPNAPTFGSRLADMERDLQSIRDRMEVDRTDSVAQAAHIAFHAVRKLREVMPDFTEGLRWDWVPTDPYELER